MNTIKVFKLAYNQLRTTVATLHTWAADLWANFEQRIIGKQVAKRLRACVNAERQHSNTCCNY